MTTFCYGKAKSRFSFPVRRPSDHQSAFRRCRSKAYAGGAFARRPLRGERRKRKRRTDGHTGEEGRKRRGGEASLAPATAPSDTQRRRRESTNQPRKESSVYPISPHSARSLAQQHPSGRQTDGQTDPPTRYASRQVRTTEYVQDGLHLVILSGRHRFPKFIPPPSPRRLLTFKSRMPCR